MSTVPPTKRCGVCGDERQIRYFEIRDQAFDWLSSDCVDCIEERRKLKHVTRRSWME